MRPRIAITLGDPRGIGPEIVGKVLADPPAGAEYFVVGPDDIIGDLPAERIAIGMSAACDSKRTGQPSGLAAKDAGFLTALQIETAVSLALEGSVDAIVTGPANKRALHLAGYRVPGHTEWLGQLAGGVETAMMLAAGRLRVVLLTTHIALRDVPDAVTRDLIVRKARMTTEALNDWWDIAQPHIAVCALNPHAGEGGLFGAEDDAILAAAAREIGAAGPIPADTVFVRALGGEFDAVLTPSHDVGMTAVKVAGFGKGVNVTLGLPFIRTAPDHGTAFDIAGQGIADPGSLQEAVSLAVRLAGSRRRP
ncbi:MAG: 4-hydroxythreonine-4-phosphate dehydrogenase PdxA [Gemmatimonadota bacterium]|nr:MAG: 4-hydroxythreonine-4-phosphate dehydrogenase PdxA [Gemmatimonadota bacterium]